MNKLAVCFITQMFCTLVSGYTCAQSPDAADVMRFMDERYDGETAITHASMVLVDKRERQRVRDIVIYRKDYELNTKSVSFFESPPDIKGTAYLNHDWEEPDRDDDSWLYLPALQKVKRIASADQSDSFLGSDFSYSDINGLELFWYEYEFVSINQMVDGHECWMIEITPKEEFKDKAEKATGYSKWHMWIRKDNYVLVQAKVWVTKRNRIKYFKATDLERIEGIWTAKTLQMVTTRNERKEHSSILRINQISYNSDLQDTIFSVENLQRGLP